MQSAGPKIPHPRQTSKIKEIEMFGILESLAKAAVGVATLPITLAADAVTLGGVLTDKNEPYTVTRIGDIVDNLEDAATP